MPPRNGAPFKGQTTFEARSLTGFLEIFTAYPQPGFYARGEPREYDEPWKPGIWREDHVYRDRDPAVAPGGFYTKGEYAAVQKCQADFRSGEFRDKYVEAWGLDKGCDVPLGSLELFHWTALAQHYNQGQRYPTRLLDVTTDALVALFFAVNSSEDQDGFVFYVNDNCNDLSTQPDTVTAGAFLDVLEIKADDGGTNYVPCDDTLNYMRPPLPNRRLEAQRGAFVWTRKIGDSYRRGGLIARIPAGAKQAMLVELSHLNYTEESLFPGGNATGR